MPVFNVPSGPLTQSGGRVWKNKTQQDVNDHNAQLHADARLNNIK